MQGDISEVLQRSHLFQHLDIARFEACSRDGINSNPLQCETQTIPDWLISKLLSSDLSKKSARHKMVLLKQALIRIINLRMIYNYKLKTYKLHSLEKDPQRIIFHPVALLQLLRQRFKDIHWVKTACEGPAFKAFKPSFRRFSSCLSSSWEDWFKKKKTS